MLYDGLVIGYAFHYGSGMTANNGHEGSEYEHDFLLEYTFPQESLKGLSYKIEYGLFDCSRHQISKLIMVGDSCFNTLSLDDSCYTLVPVPVAPQANPASPAVLIFFAAFMSLS